MKTIDWSKQHCGVMLCTFEKTIELMPDVAPILEELKPLLELPIEDYLVDVKVHMLMPGEWPCIPNWHRDFIPRDENKVKQPHLVTGEKMFIWISGHPLTEFASPGDNYLLEPGVWMPFTQNDVHRGTMSNEHTWRGFLRVIPAKFVHPGTLNVGQIRRHTQVYLDAAKYKW